jgi:hypothetical protein
MEANIMKKVLVTLLFVVTLVFGVMGIPNGYAFNFTGATNITISDEEAGNSWYGSGTRTDQGFEDQEVEPGMQQGQQWDLEAFFLNGSQLAMVGGFDFKNGVYENSDRPDRGRLDYWESGDLFISTDGKPQYGSDSYDPANPPLNFGYEYVLHMDWHWQDQTMKPTYQLIDLRGGSQTFDLAYNFGGNPNRGSDPWRWNSGGVVKGSGSISEYYTEPTNVGGLQGGAHNVAVFDLTSLDLLNSANNLYFHFTLECGNDNLMGHVDPVPEPTMLLLFGVGLVGLLGFGRKHLKK